MANADYISNPLWGFSMFAGGGLGQTFDGGNNTACEVRAGILKSLYGFTASVLYGYRWTQGSITEGHITVDDPRQERLIFKLERKF